MRFNFFRWNNMSQSISTAMPMAKLLIFFIILVRDQEAGGSNPLAPTNHLGPGFISRLRNFSHEWKRRTYLCPSV